MQDALALPWLMLTAAHNIDHTKLISKYCDLQFEGLCSRGVPQSPDRKKSYYPKREGGNSRGGGRMAGTQVSTHRIDIETEMSGTARQEGEEPRREPGILGEGGAERAE